MIETKRTQMSTHSVRLWSLDLRVITKKIQYHESGHSIANNLYIQYIQKKDVEGPDLHNIKIYYKAIIIIISENVTMEITV